MPSNSLPAAVRCRGTTAGAGWAAGRAVAARSPLHARRAVGETRTRIAAAWRQRRRLGESDCEEIRDGLIAQPVNVGSSLAYVAGGAWVAARGVQSGQSAAVAFGGLLGAVGVGSILYHGPCPPEAQAAHDTSLAAALGLVVLHNAAAMTSRHRTIPGGVQLGAAAAAAIPVLPRGRFTNQVAAVLGVAAITTEALSVRDHRPAATGGRRRGNPAALGALLNVLSRTGGPLCRPKSLLQGHAAWHLLSAFSTHFLGAWGPAPAGSVTDRGVTKRRPGRSTGCARIRCRTVRSTT